MSCRSPRAAAAIAPDGRWRAIEVSVPDINVKVENREGAQARSLLVLLGQKGKARTLLAPRRPCCAAVSGNVQFTHKTSPRS